MLHLGIPIVPAIIECQERNLNHVRSLHSSNSSHDGDGMVPGTGQVGLILHVSVCRFGEMSTFNRLARLLNRSPTPTVLVTPPLQLCFVDDSKGRSLLLSPELMRKSDSAITMATAVAAAGDSAVDMFGTSSSSSSSSSDMPLLLNTSTKSGPILDSTDEATSTLPMSTVMEATTGTHTQPSEKQPDRRGSRSVTARDPSNTNNTGSGGPAVLVARASRTRKDQNLEAPTAKALVRLTPFTITL